MTPYLFSYLLIFNVFSFPMVENNNLLETIRKQVRNIDENLPQYKAKDIPNKISAFEKLLHSSESNEMYRVMSAELIPYYKDDHLIKIEVIFQGTHNNLVSAYYFEQDKLIFVKKVKTIFHKSKVHPDFDPTKKSIVHNYFYFDDKQLIRWVDHKIQPRSRKDPEFQKKASSILDDIDIYIRLI